jgi:hypothetical protein
MVGTYHFAAAKPFERMYRWPADAILPLHGQMLPEIN